MAVLTIKPPERKWIALPYKDKRRGAIWLCKACGKWGGGKVQPTCPCMKIEV